MKKYLVWVLLAAMLLVLPLNEGALATGRLPGSGSLIPVNCSKGHNMQPVRVNNATCTKEGYIVMNCTRCGAEEVTPVPKLGHDWHNVGGQAPVCDSNGWEEYQCTRCGDHKEEPIPATGTHNWVLDNINRDDVECVAGGTAYYHCSVCNDQKNESVSATGHDWQAMAATAANCQTAQVVTYQCAKCGEQKTETVGSKADHQWYLTYSEPATCAADGYNTYKCSFCNETKTDVLPATEQCTWGDWIVAEQASCNKDGLKVAQCSVCGDTKKEMIPSEGVHDYHTVSTQEATCTQDGYKKYECSKCHKDKTETLKTEGHKWGNVTVVTAATCTAEGKQEASCTVCGAKETQTVSAAGHNWSSWKVTEEATGSKKGTRERTCKTCGKTETESYSAEKKSSSKKSSSQEVKAEEGTILVYTTSGKVNTRSGPGKDNKRVQQIPKRSTCLGELLDAQVDKKGDVWFKVEYKNKVCWVVSEYAKVVVGEPDGSIRRNDENGTELKDDLFKSSEAVAEERELEETSINDADAAEWIGDSVYVSGDPYVEQIVLFGEGYSLYGVEVGDKIKDVTKALKKQNLSLHSERADEYVYRVPVRTDALSADEDGFCGWLYVIVGQDKKVAEIQLYSDTAEYRFTSY